MRARLFLSFLAVVLIVAGCLLPWMTIETKGITISGLNTTGTSYGKPGFFHFVWTGLFLVFVLIGKVWSKRAAVGMAAFNLAWAFRNFLLIPVCQMGECPVRRVGLYVLLGASFLLFIAPLVSDKAVAETAPPSSP